MARLDKFHTITAEGRDKGKCFKLTEMPAVQGERWGRRWVAAMMRSGVNLPDGFLDFGTEAMGLVGLHALSEMRAEDSDPLFAELLGCVQIQPNPSNPFTRDLREDGEDIEEIDTILELRREVLQLHANFSIRAQFFSLIGILSSPADATPAMSDTQTLEDV